MINATGKPEAATVLVAKPSPINMKDWTVVSHWVEKALAPGKSTEEAASYFASCHHEKRQLWRLMTGDEVTGVVISEGYEHPDGLIVALPVTAAAIRSDSMRVDFSTIEWRRDIGAKRLEERPSTRCQREEFAPSLQIRDGGESCR
ncbi:hypothetical protein RLW55_16355 [Hyphomicrobium sp. B1]|uniref:hypothetical protein n=1 Tax=Hyphomicrobium sp. B1 TaxID=3075651 RepID=UPI003C2B332C